MAFPSGNTKPGRTTTDAARREYLENSARRRQVLRRVGKENQDCGGLQAAEKPPEVNHPAEASGAVLTLHLHHTVDGRETELSGERAANKNSSLE
ncbi:hypothetical protein HPP92_006196 [Vanilla planifolia]|uniref:Uncharacterized protein n=1 Tax=Vanilla planifolia TaxID=51239 RepID=A0A835RVE3_VANPL|nr:hypothetical protein HPP92_006196 [Vanilla planifolia]